MVSQNKRRDKISKPFDLLYMSQYSKYIKLFYIPIILQSALVSNLNIWEMI